MSRTTLRRLAILPALLMPLKTTPALAQCASQRLTGSGAVDDGGFGLDLALDGDVTLISAANIQSGAELITGAYVFRRDASGWTEEAILAASMFGFGVTAIQGDVALIGDPGGFVPGAYVFRRSGAAWEQETKLLSPEPSTSFQFGISTALDGDMALVGANGFINPDGSDRGAVCVFEHDGVSWSLQTILYPENPQTSTNFGWAMAVHDHVAVIGAPFGAEGSAYVFRYDGSLWHQEARLHGQPGVFGSRVAIADDVIIVSAFGEAPPDQNDVGAAYIYRFTAGDWVEEARLVSSSPTNQGRFGIEVAIENGIAAVSSESRADDPRRSVEIFDRDPITGAWITRHRVFADNGLLEDRFGHRLELENGSLLVSDWEDDSAAPQAGAVFDIQLDGLDCNDNLFCDEVDIAEGVSADCNVNGIPDACDLVLFVDTNTGPRELIGTGAQVTVAASEAPPAVDTVEFAFTAAADLAGSDRSIDVRINGLFIATLFAETGTGCPTEADLDAHTLDPGIFNLLRSLDPQGDLNIEFILSEAVDPAACAEEAFITMQMSYDAEIDNDTNGNGIPDECEFAPGDIDRDGAVDARDLIALLMAWGPCDSPAAGCPADIDGDGVVNVPDLLVILSNWG